MKKLFFPKKLIKTVLHFFPKWLRVFSIILGLTILIPLTTFAAFNMYFMGKIFPGIYINTVNVGGLTPDQATEILIQKTNTPESIKVVGQGQSFNLDTKSVGLSYKFETTSKEAFNFARTGNMLTDWVERIDLLFHPKVFALSIQLDSNELEKFIAVIDGQVSIKAVPPSITLERPRAIVSKGTPGIEVDRDKLLYEIKESLSKAISDDIQIPANIIDQTLSDSEVETLKTRAENLLGKSLSITFEYDSYDLTDKDMLDLLGARGGFNEQGLEVKLSNIASQINRDPQNPKFSFDGGKVTEFQPALDGVTVDLKELTTNVTDGLVKLEKENDKNVKIQATVNKTPPEVTTDKVNNLGIKELVGRGSSTYYHSIASRVHNVVLAASRINGTLVPPGSTFSFNETLGDVSEFTGYQQAYIISGGKTILGDGGGVCQVSTTLFRALLDAGLPITERQAHAYRVGYYEQNSSPGFDATVYSPSPDLKFKNDTGSYILIVAHANPKNYSLTFELYGTSDGRVATTTKPVVSNVTPPPEDFNDLPVDENAQIVELILGNPPGN